MQLIVVGSMGFDTVETPHGRVEKELGGTAVFFSLAASYFARVGLVAAIGTDFPEHHISMLQQRGVDLSGLIAMQGETFHWGGRYHDNMNARDTLFTHLNVFKDFRPQVPEQYREAPFVFLGNIDPVLQLHVLEQMHAPKLVALDTMNYWIDGAPGALRQVLQRVHIVFINEEEARQLSGEYNLIRAAETIQQLGPPIVVVKKGEHGAILVNRKDVFFAPGFPLQRVSDPTGAGDTFAGGFMGYLAKANAWEDRHLRRATICGSSLASFAVEDFSIHRLLAISSRDIMDRIATFHKLTSFDVDDQWLS